MCVGGGGAAEMVIMMVVVGGMVERLKNACSYFSGKGRMVIVVMKGC